MGNYTALSHHNEVTKGLFMQGNTLSTPAVILHALSMYMALKSYCGHKGNTTTTTSGCGTSSCQVTSPSYFLSNGISI